MKELTLPEQFLKRMEHLLGPEYEAFLASFQEERKNALRVNRLKLTPGQFETEAPFALERVPWTDNGYYVDYRDRPGQHPYYRAGLYYLQEPSAMAPAAILPVQPGDKVLDLCAAPGGKATELGARLGGEGILVANEISASRVRALERNIELFGIWNCIVTNEPPHALSERFGAYFDRILVDAPCSGEGMFRKNPEAARTWSLEKVDTCARTQREILLQAAAMLRPGGHLVYSTCTFEPEENELAVFHLLLERPDMELVQIPCMGQTASFCQAYSLEELRRLGYDISEGLSCACAAGGQQTDPEPAGVSSADRRVMRAGSDVETDKPDLTKAVRIWPHRAGGEGHFIALLARKMPQEAEAAVPCQRIGTAPERLLQEPFPEKNRKERAKGSRRAGKEGKKAQGRILSKGAGSGTLSKEDSRLVQQFLASYVSDLSIDICRCEMREGHVYLMPEGCPEIRGLRFLRAGLYLGELKKNRFEPSQELAMAICNRPDPACGQPGRTGSEKGGSFSDDGNDICISPDDDRLQAFLRGESLRLQGAGENGWRLVCAGRWPVGWGKLTGGVLKNHIPAAWRSQEG